MMNLENVLEAGTEVFVLSNQVFGVIVSDEKELSNEGLYDLNYYVAPSLDSLDTPIICNCNELVKILPVGTKVQIKETAFCGVILGDDRDLSIEYLDGFNYWIGEEGDEDNKLLVHHEDICLA